MRTKAQRTEDQMYRLYQDRGPMTDKDLAMAGFTPDEVAVYAPRVAARIRKETLIAA